MSIEAFSPSGSSVKVAATTSSGSVALSAVARSIRVYNSGTTSVFVAFGVGSATAATDGTNSIPIAPGAIEIFSLNTSITTAAAIMSSGTGDIWFTPGDGI